MDCLKLFEGQGPRIREIEKLDYIIFTEGEADVKVIDAVYDNLKDEICNNIVKVKNVAKIEVRGANNIPKVVKSSIKLAEHAKVVILVDKDKKQDIIEQLNGRKIKDNEISTTIEIKAGNTAKEILVYSTKFENLEEHIKQLVGSDYKSGRKILDKDPDYYVSAIKNAEKDRVKEVFYYIYRMISDIIV